MKNNMFHLVKVIILLSLVLTSCKDNDIDVNDVVLNKTFFVTGPGKSFELTATVTPDDATHKTVIWETTDSSVAEVVDGVVTAKSEGEAVISATAGDKSATCDVSVTTKKVTLTTESTNISLSMAGPGGIAIDWGDEKEIEMFSLTSDIYNVGHYYSGKSSRTITIIGANITILSCMNNSITGLDIGKNSTIKSLWCNNNQITTIDVSDNKALNDFSCRDNQITEINVKGCTGLNILRCYGNYLTSCDVNDCLWLRELYCQNNRINNLNIDGCTSLSILDCSVNLLTKLELINNTALTSITCNGNIIDELNLNNNIELLLLNCENNLITELDMSTNTKLQELNCSINELTSDNINNLFESLHNNNISGKSVDISFNPGTNSCSESIATSKGWVVISN